MAINRSLRYYLRQGGVIAYATDSCFGLGCDPKSRLGLQRILRIKGRPQHKGVIIIAAKQAQLKPYFAPLNLNQQNSLDSTWSGSKVKTKPHTWLVPAAHNCPPWLSGRFNSIAARVTQHKASKALCCQLDMALVSTSANKSGCKSAKTSRECYRLFGKQIRVIHGLIGQQKRPSTIQDLTTNRIIRA
ncbi:MAG: Sua5/YciO/YrdC/YwlC family protein [Methylophilaceae bacterium]|nr:Sua5/YciO/YrdC/YwlC family protein [Methylophilaceae bacterium]